MQIGKLSFSPIEANLELAGKTTANYIKAYGPKNILVTEIDPKISDTQAFCEKYGIGLDISVNCVIVEAKRADRVWYAACLIPATRRIDINGAVRRQLDAKKVSFAPMEKATSTSLMEYGAITPIGLPSEWPLLIDKSVSRLEHVIIGSGIRKSKLLVDGKFLASLPNALVLHLIKTA